MNLLDNAIGHDTTNALGWTLVHSVWQGFAIFILVWAILKFLANTSSHVRYAVTCAGMLTVLVTSVVTFTMVHSTTENDFNNSSVSVSTMDATSEALGPDESPGVIGTALSLIETNMTLFLYAWFFGACLFALRLFGGWWYIRRLAKNATDIRNHWADLLADLASRLEVSSLVRLAESAVVKTPMVIGYFKPVILIPVGMLSGLTTAQIETIFLHELAHIKRHDFIVNIIQSCIEVLFFFNPFVWIISGLVRKEREFCCDDTVITHHANAIDYARALTRLEEARISFASPGLALADNKNELLTRIKRIMERSLRPSGGRERLLPIALIVAGLLCASWLTIRTDQKNTDGSTYADADTLKKQKRHARYQRSAVTTTDENGEPHQHIIDSYERDEELRPLVAPLDVEALAEVPDVYFDLPQIPPLEPIEMDLYNPMNLDSVPDRRAFRNRDWEAFHEEFEKEFRERFEDFYEKHEKDLTMMMEELQEKFKGDFKEADWRALEQAEMARIEAGKFNEQFPFVVEVEEALKAQEQAVLAQEMAAAELHGQVIEVQDLAHEVEALQLKNEMQLKEMERNMKEVERNLQAFEKRLKEELVKDAYISKSEEIRDMHWDDNGEIQVNGKKIREADRKKYQDLHKKYFREGPGRFRYAE
jgi:bla regulator protein blaR1